jgi:hypothetical protein
MKGNIVCYIIVLSFLEWPDTFIDQSRLTIDLIGMHL